jgi:hypothetical protein
MDNSMESDKYNTATSIAQPESNVVLSAFSMADVTRSLVRGYLLVKPEVLDPKIATIHLMQATLPQCQCRKRNGFELKEKS